MNSLKKVFLMDKEQWGKIRSKGFFHYLMVTGLLKIGGVAGLITLLLIYLNTIQYELSDFNVLYFLAEFAVWLPLTFTIGIVTAAIIWCDFENRFGDKAE